MNVWNNVMTNEITVVDDTKATTSFLAGEIVKDGIINIYDLSAVLSPRDNALPQALGVAAVALSYRWKHNTLLSILLGTATVMLVMRIV